MCSDWDLAGEIDGTAKEIAIGNNVLRIKVPDRNTFSKALVKYTANTYPSLSISRLRVDFDIKLTKTPGKGRGEVPLIWRIYWLRKVKSV